MPWRSQAEPGRAKISRMNLLSSESAVRHYISVNPDKSSIRRSMREMLRSMSPGCIQEKSRLLVAEIVRSAIWQDARCVMIFLPMPGEPDVRSLWTPTKKLCVPWMDGDEINVRLVTMENMLYGTSSAREQQLIAPDELDLILVPGLAFTPAGERLGRGKGHFDRFLAGTSAIRVGVCFTEQLQTTLPTEPHDIKMHHLVTA